MKRSILIVISLCFVLAVPLVSSAEVNVSIGIPAPFVFAEPPDLVVVPSDDVDVYMVPDTPGLYFYNNWWFRFDDGRWYRARSYNGRWAHIDRHRVPRYVIDVPPDYWRHLPREYHRIHYGDFHRHWRSWGRDRHWRKYDWYNRGHRERMREHYRPERDHGRSRDFRHDGRMDRDRRDGRMMERNERHGGRENGRSDNRMGDDRRDRGNRR
jgi:hypothetical protein